MICCGHTAVQYLGLPMAVYMKHPPRSCNYRVSFFVAARSKYHAPAMPVILEPSLSRRLSCGDRIFHVMPGSEAVTVKV